MVKRILIITNSLSGGGAENSMAILHDSLISSGIDTHLLCLNQDPKWITTQHPKNVVILERNWGAGIAGTVKNFFAFRKAVRTLKPNVILGNCELPELYLSLIGLSGIDTYCVEHTSNPWFNRKTLGFLVRLILIFKHVRWASVSSEATGIWPTNSKPTYIPNSIKKPSIQLEVNKEYSLAFIGRLRSEKRPDWAIAVSEITGVPINFYGDGPMALQLKENASDRKIRATFNGYTENVWDSIDTKTVIIVPSEFEGDGLSVVEAIVRGNPLILADNHDLRRFGLSNESYCTSPRDMAERLLEARANEFMFLKPSKSIIEKYLSERSIESVRRTWIDFLDLN